MNNFGVGVLLGILGGNRRTVEAVESSLGKTITALELADDCLTLTFDDNTKLRLYDNGQSYCEDRYMRTDDNLSDYIGGRFLGIELRDAPDQESEWGVHEVQFLTVKTSEGELVISNHNKHNGYYGGFCVEAVVIIPS